MASIPILVAVVSAIALPVVGTGIYYSVKPSKQEESTQQKPEKTRETPPSSTRLPTIPVNWGTAIQPTREHGGFTNLGGIPSHTIGGSSRLDTERFRTPEVSLQPFIERSNQEAAEATKDIEGLLSGTGVDKLSGVRLPSSVTVREVETHSVSSHSSLTRT